MKRLYSFGKKKTDGDSDMLETLGGKGAHLAGMSKLGMNVPFGFTIPTDYCVEFNKIVGDSFASRNKKKKIIFKLSERSVKRLDYLKTVYKIKSDHVCLFSVRSGARVSMPGMMDTILNVGITSENFPTLEKQLGKQCANDCLSRLIKMYGEIVKKVNKEKFVTLEDKFVESTTNNEIYSKETGEVFPDSLQDQLNGAIKAVFESWNNPRAIQYREHHGYSHDWGTAVTIQRMVFGNLNDSSCSGVYFTRDPSSGENVLTGEFLPNAQGEDVVAGVVTPFPIANNLTFYEELKEIGLKLEKHYKNVQDIEFTIEDGEVYILQTRTAKQSPIATFKITNDFVKEGLIDLQTAKTRLTGELFERSYLPTIKNKPKSDSVGLGASNGIVCGGCFRNIDEYNAIKKTGSKAIFTAVETTPDDLDLIMKADAVLTKIGGFTCVSSDTDILTDKGVLAADVLFSLIEKGEKIKALTLRNEKPYWLPITKAIKKQGVTRKLSFGSKHKTKHDHINITSDHKIMCSTVFGSFVKRRVDHPINKVVICVKDLPESNFVDYSENFLYLMGLIATDGYVHLNNRRGGVIFTQVQKGLKINLIQRAEKLFEEVFNYTPNKYFRKDSTAQIKGRTIKTSGVVDLVCPKKSAANIVLNFQQCLAKDCLNFSKSQALAFIAGCAEGDGSSAGNRLNLYVSKKWLRDALLICCIKADVRAISTPNRDIENLQLSHNVELVTDLTVRFKDLKSGKTHRRLYRAAEIQKTNEKPNKHSQAVKRDLLVDGDKVGYSKSWEHQWMFLDTPEKQEMVYDFTVDGSNESEHSYCVMSTGGRLVWISNCHAAVVCRGLDKPCVTGVSDLDLPVNQITTIDGSTGEVWYKVLEIEEADFNIDALELLDKLSVGIDQSDYDFIDICDLPDIDSINSNVILIENSVYEENEVFDALMGAETKFNLNSILEFITSLENKGFKVFDSRSETSLPYLFVPKIKSFDEFTQLFTNQCLIIDRPLSSVLGEHYEKVLEVLPNTEVELAKLIPYPLNVFKKAYNVLG